MAGLLDSLCITPEDSAAKSHCKMTSFVHKDKYLLPTQKMHIIMLFVQNVAYADCLWGFISELANPNDPNTSAEQLNGICSYYSTLLEIHTCIELTDFILMLLYYKCSRSSTLILLLLY